jgi:hypothetical protein
VTGGVQIMPRLLGFVLGSVAAIWVVVSYMDREQLVALKQGLGRAFSVASARLAPPEQVPNAAPADAVSDEVAISAAPDPPPEEAPGSKAEAPQTAQESREEVHWQAFWSRFHSELSAQGFAERLTGRTDVRYRVRPTGRGIYEVVFAYRDEAEREAALARIESATGLRLQGVRP